MDENNVIKDNGKLFDAETIIALIGVAPLFLLLAFVLVAAAVGLTVTVIWPMIETAVTFGSG